MSRSLTGRSERAGRQQAATRGRFRKGVTGNAGGRPKSIAPADSMTPRRLYNFRIDPELEAGLKAVNARDGISESEQIRRALWRC